MEFYMFFSPYFIIALIKATFQIFKSIFDVIIFADSTEQQNSATKLNAFAQCRFSFANFIIMMFSTPWFFANSPRLWHVFYLQCQIEFTPKMLIMYTQHIQNEQSNEHIQSPEIKLEYFFLIFI